MNFPNERIPPGAISILRGLGDAGFPSYLVGGCVRDMLMERNPKDWDITTQATPTEVKTWADSQSIRVLDTGLKHGTVTLLMEDGQYEVTTFRVDGNYSDGRHPDSVQYTDDIKEDLSRRDFRMNAIAYDPILNVHVDPFHGCADIRDRTIRSVGDPAERFREDGLRILRAMRFSTNLGFRLSDPLISAIHEERDLLRHISAERIQSELCKMLNPHVHDKQGDLHMYPGTQIREIMEEFPDIFCIFIPELYPCIDFNQHSRFHDHLLWGHIIQAIYFDTSRDLDVRLALLLHDVGKPYSFQEEMDGTRHFRHHAEVGAEIAKQVLTRLRFDNKRIDTVTQLVQYHDATIPVNKKAVKKWLSKLREELFRKLVQMIHADRVGHKMDTSLFQSADEWKDDILQILDEVLESQECFTVKDLAIGGKDLIEAGYTPGPQFKACLNSCLEMVIAETIPNERESLLNHARFYLGA